MKDALQNLLIKGVIIMKYTYDHDFHIHSRLSLCSNHPEQTPENILNYAKENGLKKIVLTDHFWDPDVPGTENGFYIQQPLDRIKEALPLPQEDGIDFLFGGETDMSMDYTVGISPAHYNDLDFIIIPTTHFHFVGSMISEEDSKKPSSRAECWIKRLEALLAMNLPFEKVGIAHLACGLIAPSKQELLEVFSLLPHDRMAKAFEKAADLGVGIELNACDMPLMIEQPDVVAPIFLIAKQQGCKFYCASDSHAPKDFIGLKQIFENSIDLLDLKESDKFLLNGV